MKMLIGVNKTSFYPVNDIAYVVPLGVPVQRPAGVKIPIWDCVPVSSNKEKRRSWPSIVLRILDRAPVLWIEAIKRQVFVVEPQCAALQSQGRSMNRPYKEGL